MKFFNTVDANDNTFSLSNSVTGSADVTVVSTDSAELYLFPLSEYRGAKFVIQTSTTTDYSIREILGIHNTTDGFLTEYAIVSTAQELETDDYQFYLNSPNAVLSVTPSTETARTIKIHAILMKHE